MAFDPWYKASLPLVVGGARLSLRIPHELFSTQQIDEGTLLLLANLGAGEPKSILDMGCGYGALGLPVAARYPKARVEMVDRDLLAVAYSALNAEQGSLENARVHGSLGFRDLEAGAAPYDWVLCNVPARIGKSFIAHLFGHGRALLAPGGEVRVVVIRDLGPVVEEIGREQGWPIERRATGSRHIIYLLAAPAERLSALLPSDEALYGRDEVELGGLRFLRPHDLGGDDPRRLKSGLPVLLDALPRQPPERILAFRFGYGIAPLTCAKRNPEASVVGVERDLLATTFTRLNAQRLGVEARLRLIEAAHWPTALADDQRFELALGELSASAGEKVAEDELCALARHLAPGGEALVLCLEKLEREWVRAIAARRKLAITKVIGREGFSVLRIAPAARER